MPPKPKRKETGPSRSKLDPRLALLLSLPDKRRRALKAEEDARLAGLAKEIAAAAAALDQAKDSDRERAVHKLRELDRRLFAPLTHGLFIPPESARAKAWPIRMKEPFVSAFILSDAS